MELEELVLEEGEGLGMLGKRCPEEAVMPRCSYKTTMPKPREQRQTSIQSLALRFKTTDSQLKSGATPWLEEEWNLNKAGSRIRSPRVGRHHCIEAVGRAQPHHR